MPLVYLGNAYSHHEYTRGLDVAIPECLGQGKRLPHTSLDVSVRVCTNVDLSVVRKRHPAQKSDLCKSRAANRLSTYSSLRGYFVKLRDFDSA